MFPCLTSAESTLDGRAVGHVAETGQYAAQRIGQVEGGLVVVIQCAQQPASQAVVIEVTFVRTCIEVGMFLQSEGIDGHSGATTGGRATQDTVARGVVDGEVLVVGTSIPTDEVIQEVIGEGRGGASGGVVVEIIIYSLNGQYASL